MTDLSIIIVNWNSVEFAKNCIASIQATASGVDCEVIVVDNASPDGGCGELAASFPWVKVIALERNIGFGAANNLGAKQASGRNLLFLNPDTLVLGNALARMVAALVAEKERGAIGCRLLNGDRTLQITSVQPFPTILNQLLAFAWLKRRWPSLPLFGMRALYTASRNELNEVDVVSGACLMVKKHVFEQAGGFHHDYFMYAEEVDLCHSIQRAGWKVLHLGDAQVVHFGGQSSKKREDCFSDILMRDSVFKFLKRSRGSPYAFLYRAMLCLSAMARLTVLLIVFPFSAFPNRYVRRDAVKRAFKKWRNIASWSLALASWTQELGKVCSEPISATKEQIFETSPASRENT